MNVYYTVQRTLMVVPTIMGITMITFFLLKALPGDPAYGLAGERADAEVIARFSQEFGNNASVAAQYVGYLKLLVRGEFGHSYYTNRRVAEDLAEKLPRTFQLACAALCVAAGCGIGIGVVMAVFRGRLIDRCCLMLTATFIAMPVFWLGLLLMYVFCFVLKLLPPAGSDGGRLMFLVLPASTLGVHAAASLARITRASMIDVLAQPYITTARAKGLPAAGVILRHALKNALIPVITMIGLDFGSFLNGAVLTETIFGWDGIGRYAVEGVFRRDYPVVLGCVLIGAVLFVVVNLVVDLTYALCDPRIRHSKKM
ncbi:MAG: ABC transporter permease [Desulfobacterota bacterium]|nr:ABC transporter permease [Thermodesulfobacteriota bacterium]